jgi:signal transduction histidine kinase
MRRRWTAAAAVLAGAGALAALVWMSAQLLRLESAEARARLEAAREQAANLALWRMDLSLARLVAEEGLRASGEAAPARAPEHVVLHFERGPGGELWSPEVGSGAIRPERLAALSTELRPQPIAALVERQAAAYEQAANAPAPPGDAQQARQQVDVQLRNQLVQRNVSKRYGKVAAVDDLPEAPPAAPPRAGPAPVLTAVWSGESLLLVYGDPGGEGRLVGALLDWPGLEQDLLAGVRDLLPQAHLAPVKQPGARLPHMLATIPVQLVPGEPADLPAPTRSARNGLYLAWAALAVAGLALGAIAFGAIALATRKTAFATAVTHELRTPLTTFRLYSEMLEGGLVPPDQLGGYLATLRAESERLSHLVENVLAWSRIERGRFGALQSLEVREILEREVPRLEEAARRAGMAVAVSAEGIEGLSLRGEPTAVSQILFNLVDNACKHARAAADRRIELTVRADAERVRVSVRDHGPGVPPRTSRRLFRAFTRPASDAARSATPGVGLGLPLSRRLARAMGGSLELTASSEAGAVFELALPRA